MLKCIQLVLATSSVLLIGCASSRPTAEFQIQNSEQISPSDQLICSEFLKVANKFATRDREGFLYFDPAVSYKFSNQNMSFPKWEMVDRKISNNLVNSNTNILKLFSRKNSSISESNYDFDNDGDNDLVLKLSSTAKRKKISSCFDVKKSGSFYSNDMSRITGNLDDRYYVPCNAFLYKNITYLYGEAGIYKFITDNQNRRSSQGICSFDIKRKKNI